MADESGRTDSATDPDDSAEDSVDREATAGPDATSERSQSDVDSTSGNPPTADAGAADGNARAGADPSGGRPEVVVPMDLYKTVTVFSTLFSIALVVAGMIALDSATARATRSAGEVNLPIAIVGVAAIVLGAATYAFAARFRAAGMGNPKDADDER